MEIGFKADENDQVIDKFSHLMLIQIILNMKDFI